MKLGQSRGRSQFSLPSGPERYAGPSAQRNTAYNRLFKAPPSPYAKSVTGSGSAIETDWLRGLVLPQLLVNVPIQRATTYYFAQAGNDTTGNGSEATPWKSLAKANAIIAASSGNLRLRFNRGDVWREAQDLLVGKDNVTLDAYGSGAAPIFTGFTTQYNAGGWTNVSGNTWSRAETTQPAWVRAQSEQAGVAFDPLKREDTQAHCIAFAKSWAWVSNVLYLNTGGANPNSVTYEMIPEVSPAKFWQVTGDNVRLQDLKVHGSGMGLDGTAYGLQFYHTNSSGVKEGLAVDCDFLYTGYHSIGHICGATNRMTLLRCRVGYCANRDGNGGANSGDAIPIVSYAGAGGQEYWLFDNVVVGGGLPSYDWQAAAGGKHGTAGIYCHTNDDTQYAPIVAAAVGTQYLANPYQCRVGTVINGPRSSSDQIEDVRAWIIGEDVPALGPWTTLGVGGKDRVWINCKYAISNTLAGHVAMFAGGPLILGNATFKMEAWALNCTLTVTLTGGDASGEMFLFGENGGSIPPNAVLINCRVRVVGLQYASGLRMSFTDFGSRARNINVEVSAEDTGARAGFGMVYSYNGNIPSTAFSYCALAQPNDPATYPNIYPGGAGFHTVAYSIGSTIPATAPTVGDLRRGAGAPTLLEYDQAGSPRVQGRYDIGPLVGV